MKPCPMTVHSIKLSGEQHDFLKRWVQQELALAEGMDHKMYIYFYKGLMEALDNAKEESYYDTNQAEAGAET